MSCEKKDCVYRSENCGWLVTCDYLLMTGELRGCPIEDCDKYTPGERHKWEAQTWWWIQRRDK